MVTNLVEASLGVEVEDMGEEAAAVGLPAEAGMTRHRPIHVTPHLRVKRLIHREGPQMLRAGGQASGPALRLEQPEPIWPVIVDKRNRHRGPEDGAGAALIMVKAAQVEGQDLCLRPALPFHRRGIQALGLEVQAGDN